MRLLIVADDPLARAGLALMLSEQDGLVIVGQLANEADIVTELEAYRPDVILWDLGWEPTRALPTVRSGGMAIDEATDTVFEQLAELRENQWPLVVLVSDETQVTEVWASGVQAILMRQAEPAKLVLAFQATQQNLILLDPIFSDALLTPIPSTPATLIDDLTPRESEVLQLLAEGLTNKAIAHRLRVSDHTVKFHVNAIMSKLGAQSRTEAVVQASRLGLILL